MSSAARAVGLVAALAGLGATPIEDSRYGFKVVIPDGFEPHRTDESDPFLLYTFLRQPVDPAKPAMVVRILRLGGTLPPAGQLKNQTKGGARFETMTDRWKGHTIDHTRMAMDVNGVPVVGHSAHVPLSPEGITVMVLGNAEDEGEVKSILANALATVDGQTNRDHVQTRAGWTCVALVVALAFVVIVKYNRRHNHRDDSMSPLPDGAG